MIKDFNYEYVLIEGFAKKPEEIDFKITEDIHIKGNYYKKFIKGSDSYYLYKVSNVRDLVENEEYHSATKLRKLSFGFPLDFTVDTNNL